MFRIEKASPFSILVVSTYDEEELVYMIIVLTLPSTSKYLLSGESGITCHAII